MSPRGPCADALVASLVLLGGDGAFGKQGLGEGIYVTGEGKDGNPTLLAFLGFLDTLMGNASNMGSRHEELHHHRPNYRPD